MMLELLLPCAAFLAMGLMEPDDRQREQARRGLSGHPLRRQLVVLRRLGLIRRR